MGHAIPVRMDYTAGEVRRLAQRAKDAAQARRLLAIAAVLESALREEAAKIGGMDRHSPEDHVHRATRLGSSRSLNLRIGMRPSTITVSVSGNVMTCHRRMAVGCRSVARLRSAAWCHRNQDRWRSQQR